MRVHMLPPQFVPNKPQVIVDKKLSQRGRSRPLPRLVKQAEHAKQDEDGCRYLRKNSRLHLSARAHRFYGQNQAGTFPSVEWEKRKQLRPSLKHFYLPGLAGAEAGAGFVP